MVAKIKVGRRLISPKIAKNKKGTQGVFLTEREWKAILTELKVKSANDAKGSVFQGAMKSLDEVELYLQGRKKLRNAHELIDEL
jgi:hypothetical protein